MINSLTKTNIKNPKENPLEEILREGARKMLQEAIEAEVQEFCDYYKNLRDEKGQRIIIRNGFLPERQIQAGIGPISIRQPRVRDKKNIHHFSSNILPKYLRKCPSIEALLPALYLRGISSGNMQEALCAILGQNAKGLSANTVGRLKQIWEKEYRSWQNRSLSGKQYVYLWADGIYFNVRLGRNDRPCILVLIGATKEGNKELLAIHDGYRESKLSWQEVLQDLKRRGLYHIPSLSIGDGALGFWSALEEEFPKTKKQRCWVHKTANILDKMPKSIQGHAKKMIHDIYLAPSKEKALKSYDAFFHLYEKKYERACQCLKKDKELLFTFYNFPAEHGPSIRITNPIESTFATIRHRTRQTKGCGSRLATLTMVFKLAKSAQKKWRKLRGYWLIEKVIKGVKFQDGEEMPKQKESVA